MHVKSRVKEWNERNNEIEFRTSPWRQWEGNAYSMAAHVLLWVFGQLLIIFLPHQGKENPNKNKIENKT